MKIHQLISGPTIALTNEENQFVQKHQEEIGRAHV